MNPELIQLMEGLNEAELRALIQSLYGQNESIDARIESRLLAADSSAQAIHLKKQIASLEHDSDFIGWNESSAFAREIEHLLDDIDAMIAADPVAAFQLADAFMSTHEKVLNRCDDSNGSIGGAYRFGVGTWLKAARAWQASGTPCKLDWRVELRKRHADNDYAVWDTLISDSAELLGEKTLRQMAADFEAEVLQAVPDTKEGARNWATLVSEQGIRAVARALGDVELYAYATTIVRENPNELQRADIARFCLAQNDGEAALRWLGGEWAGRFQGDRDSLLDQAYAQLGREEELLSLRRAVYEQAPGVHELEALLALTPAEERETLIQRAVLKAYDDDRIYIAVDTLLALGVSGAAADYVLEHPDRLDQVGYNTHIDWANAFESQQLPLAAVLCYRKLLLDILAVARSKAYGHAANYYASLARLDRQIDDYGPIIDADVFEYALRQKHGRKHAFWRRVD